MNRNSLVLLIFVILLAGSGVLFFIFHQNSSSDFILFSSSGERSSKSPTEPPHYEATAVVERVLDGDTILVDIREILIPREGIETKSEKIRLAKIDVEETHVSDAREKHNFVENMSQSEYEKTDYYRHALSSRDLVATLVPEGCKVYLDFDDLAGVRKPYRGVFGRLIAVVYARVEGRWINVNARVLRQGFPEHVTITSFKSEFQADSWMESDYPYI